MSGRVQFTCDGVQVEVDAAPGETLLSALREHLGIVSLKDGCAPQGQCGCCTVLVDGAARVACVTPLARIAGREVTTVNGLAPDVRDAIAAAFVATGGAQCGFCTPGIVVRAAALRAKGGARVCRRRPQRWPRTSVAAPDGARSSTRLPRPGRRPTRLHSPIRSGSTPRRRAPSSKAGLARPSGCASRWERADSPTTPRRARRSWPCRGRPGATAPSEPAAGVDWVIAGSLFEARELAGKVQGRRTTVDAAPPLPLPDRPDGGVRLATSWVEPAYLEPDASWCVPGGEPAGPLANGGAFGGKTTSPVAAAARELADRYGRAVRVLFSREDVVRLGPKRPPFAASAVLREGRLQIEGVVAGDVLEQDLAAAHYVGLDTTISIRCTRLIGPPTSSAARAAGFAELCVVQEGALDAAGFDRAAHLPSARAASVFLDNVVAGPGDGAMAGARVVIDATSGALERVEVRIAAGDPLDEVVLRSYAIGAAHMALGWVLTEGLAVDPETGEVQDLTIRSFGVIRAKDTPPIDVTVVDDPGPPRRRASDSVFAAVAAAAWNALTVAEGTRPESFPATLHPHRPYAPDVSSHTSPQPVPTPSAPPRRGSVLRRGARRRLARAGGSGPARPGHREAGRRRRGRAVPPGARRTSTRCSATAGWRSPTSRRPPCSSRTSATSPR